MAAIDKAAIGFSMAIVAAGIGVAFIGGPTSDTTTAPVVAIPTPEAPSMPSPTVIPEEPTMTDPFADIAAKVKSGETGLPVVEREPEPAEMEPSVSVTAPKVEAPPTAAAGPMTVSVSMPAGTAVPGCEETNECYIPASVTINVGDTVLWTNDDTAAHTVTSGSPTEGPSGVFDSSLVMGGATYEFTFNESGSYDYFCMVHPWMIGDVQVN